MDETHPTFVDVLTLEWLKHLVVKTTAIGAFKVAEFNHLFLSVSGPRGRDRGMKRKELAQRT